VPELLSFILPEYPTAKAYKLVLCSGISRKIRQDENFGGGGKGNEIHQFVKSNRDGAGHSNVGKALRIFKGYPEIQGMKFVSGDVKIKINHYD
jgi:hypothetical protein